MQAGLVRRKLRRKRRLFRKLKNELNALDKQIADAESQLAALRKIFRESYPDIRNRAAALEILRTRRERLQFASLNEQIADVDRNLERLRKIYRPSYPDIRNLEQQRQILTNRLDELTKKQ